MNAREQAAAWWAETLTDEAARIERSTVLERARLHRLRVDSARQEATVHDALAAQDARLFRCRGCGDWRYRHTGQPVRCPVCGVSERAERRAA